MAPASRSLRAIIPIVAILGCLLPTHLLQGQAVDRFFPSRDYSVTLLAAPREPVTSARFVYNDVEPGVFNKRLVGEAALGTTLPLYLIAGNSTASALVVSAEGAVFGRFAITTITRDLIATDWVFAVPFTLLRGANWLRLRYFHTSAHMGDEYIARFDTYEDAYSRDAAELTAFYQVTNTLGLYGGGSWTFNAHPDELKRFVFQGGVQIEAPETEAPFLLYLAADVQWEQNNSWEPRMNIQAGVRLPEFEGRRSIRVAAEFLAGPTPMGQFYGEYVRHFTFGLYIHP